MQVLVKSRGMIKRLLLVFIIALILNFLWEELHSVLYVQHQNGPVTNFVLFRAALFDALIITLLAIPFLKFEFLAKRLWIFVILAVLFSIGLELFAIKTNRWEYSPNMPLVPFLNTGLTPTIQLGLLGYGTLLLMRRLKIWV